MTHTVITFMSATPRDTKYKFDDDPEEYKGRIFGEALLTRRERGKMPFDRLLLCVTDSIYEDLSRFEKGEIEDERRRGNLQNVREILDRLDKVPEVECLTIKTGRDKHEVWDIFNAVISKIDTGEQITFDITHGLRSIPFMVFLFAAFLKSAKDVEIKAIYYGAADLGSESKSSPVVDLSPFVEMLDWINASDQFIHTGNANRLADLLAVVKEQKRAAETLKSVSQAAFLCQPVSLMKASTSLRPHLERAAASFSYTSKPFSVLSENIIGIFDDFALKDPLDNPLEFIRREWKMIEWYAGHGQMLHAVTLAREVMIDAVAVRYEKNIHLKHDQRSTLEKAISGIAKIGQPITDEHTGEKRKFNVDDLNRIGYQIYNEWPDAESMAKNFSNLTKLRNQMSHAEHQADRMNLPKVERQISEVLDALHQLLIKWQILPSDETPPSD